MRTVSLGALVSEFEQRADIQNNQAFDAAEKRRLVNQALTDLYDQLVAAGPPDYYLKDYQFTTAADVAGYTLPEDFLKIRRVQVVEQGQRRRSLLQMQPDERILLVPPGQASTIVLEYIPVCAPLTNDADTFDGVNGWEELAVLWCTLKAYRKLRLPIGEVAAEYAAMMKRVQDQAYQDPGTPPRIQQASLREPMWPWTSTAQPVTHYRLRGLGGVRTLEIWRRDLIATVPA